MRAEILNFARIFFLKALNKHASIKTKYLRANYSPFVTED